MGGLCVVNITIGSIEFSLKIMVLSSDDGGEGLHFNLIL
jgi:hypothetical protein